MRNNNAAKGIGLMTLANRGAMGAFSSSPAIGGGGGYSADAVLFDGTNDGMFTSGELTGNVNGKVGIISTFVKLTTFSNLDKIYVTNVGRINLESASGWLRFRLIDTVGVTIVDMDSAGIMPLGSWQHILIGWDLIAGKQMMYINDVQKDLKTATSTNDIVYQASTHYVGVIGASNRYDGCMSDLYYNNEEYLDFTIESNRRLFADGSNKPIDLGADGSTPTGNPPRIFLSGDDTNFQDNLGTGGPFTVAGALTNCADSPSD